MLFLTKITFMILLIVRDRNLHFGDKQNVKHSIIFTLKGCKNHWLPTNLTYSAHTQKFKQVLLRLHSFCLKKKKPSHICWTGLLALPRALLHPFMRIKPCPVPRQSHHLIPHQWGRDGKGTLLPPGRNLRINYKI